MPKEPTTDRVRSYFEQFAPTLRAEGEVLGARSVDGTRTAVGCFERDRRRARDRHRHGHEPLFYAADVRLTGVDLSPAMLSEARRRAAELKREVDLREADAQALEFPDGQFEAVVFSLCLCSIPDDRRAVAEGVRVLKPRGRMLLIEHVRSPLPGGAGGPATSRAADAAVPG